MNSFLIRLLAVVAWLTSSSAGAAPDEASVRRLVMVIEYIAGDYGAAVQNGQVVSADEYKEMHDFAASAEREFAKIETELPVASRQEVTSNLGTLKTLITSKADQSAVRAVVKTIKERVIASATFATSPAQAPDRDVALKVYGQLCASCHGENGLGDGPASKGMEPPPRNFHETDVLVVSSPFKFYNTLELGVEGTQMASFKDAVPEADRWSLAFLLMAWRFGGVAAPGADLPSDLKARLEPAGLSLERLAKSSDQDLTQWLQSAAQMTGTEAENTLALLRTTAPFAPTVRVHSAVDTAATPGAPAGTALTETQRFELIATNFKAARERFAAGDGQAAEALLLDTYLTGFEGLEKPLGVAHKALVGKVEDAFIGSRQAARDGDRAAFDERMARLEGLIADAKSKLGTGQAGLAGAGAGEFVSGAVIILREGFEAFLIIAALLALLTNAGAATLKKWVHVGWLSAIVAGFASYYAFTWVFKLSGAGREVVEAVSTGLAAVVLFYVSFWLLNQRERGKWDKFIKASAKSSATAQKGVGTLFFIAFIAVYREAAETVLFYQALSAGAASQVAVWSGFAAGAAALFLVCYAILKLGVRLPLKQFFLITSSLMIAISIVLAGKAVHELVEAGIVDPTEIAHFPRIDVLGIYPNWESLGVQIVAVALTAAVFLVSSKRRGNLAS